MMMVVTMSMSYWSKERRLSCNSSGHSHSCRSRVSHFVAADFRGDDVNEDDATEADPLREREFMDRLVEVRKCLEERVDVRNLLRSFPNMSFALPRDLSAKKEEKSAAHGPQQINTET